MIIDVNIEKEGNKVKSDVSKTNFRSAISNNIDAIKYGAAYFPNLQTTYAYDYGKATIAMKFSADVQKIEVDAVIDGAKVKIKPYENH